MDFGLGALGLTMMLLVWAGVVTLAIWLVRLLFPTAKKQSNDHSAPLSPPEGRKIGQAQGELAGEQHEQR